MGTATYFSPEQAEGIGVDARSDIYSLGVVLFEMLTGRPPFLGDTPVAVASKHVRDTPPTAARAQPDVPVELEAVVMKAMAKSPDQRYRPPRTSAPTSSASSRAGRSWPARQRRRRRHRGHGRRWSRPGHGDRRAPHRGLPSCRAAAPGDGPSAPGRLGLAGAAGRCSWSPWRSSPISCVSTLHRAGSRCPTWSASRWPRPSRCCTAKGLVVGTDHRHGPTTATAGTVLSTDPAAGTNVSKKAVVNLVVSAGEAQVKVPSVGRRRPRERRGDAHERAA